MAQNFPDFRGTREWQDITALPGYGALVGKRVVIQAKSGTYNAVWFGSVAPPEASSGIPAPAHRDVSGSGDHIWVRGDTRFAILLEEFADGIAHPALPFDTTGLASPHRGTVLYDHNFMDRIAREHTFTHLFTPGEANKSGSTQWIDRGGVGRVATMIEKNAAGKEAMGIARLSQYYGDGVYLYEGIHSIEVQCLNRTYPRWYDIGIDHANFDGSKRCFLRLRYLNYDELAGGYARRWQLLMGNDPNMDARNLGTGESIWLENENKALPIKIDLMFDTREERYLGVRIGNRPDLALGTLAPNPNDDLRNLGPVYSHALTSFHEGFNLCQSVVNRTTGSNSCGQINCHAARLTYLGKIY